MDALRKKRLESSIRKEFASLILKRSRKDDRFGLISVTRSDLAPDLSRLRIWVSLFGDKQDSSQSWLALQDHCLFFQSAIGRSLRLRQTPQLSIEMDDSIKEGDRINMLMDND